SAAGNHVAGLLESGFAVFVHGGLDDVFTLGLTFGFFGRAGDVDLDDGRDLSVQAHSDLVNAQRLDRGVEHDLAALDLAAFGRDGLDDVASGDRTVQLTRLTGLPDHDIGLAVDLGADGASVGLVLLVAGLDGGAVEFERLQVGGRGPTGLVARQKEVTGEAVLDGYDIADGAEVIDAFKQNDLHITSPRRAGGPDSGRA